jgi:glycine/D-amino acid oxidase-like deaminating enzyme
MILQIRRSRFSGVVPEVRIEESCMYTMTPDSHPIIDTLPTAPNIAIGAGFSGHLETIADSIEEGRAASKSPH